MCQLSERINTLSRKLLHNFLILFLQWFNGALIASLKIKYWQASQLPVKGENVTIQAVIARAFSARSNLVLNRKNHALGDCFTRKKRSFAVTPLFRVDG